MKTKNIQSVSSYIPPMLTVIEVVVEHGFAGTNGGNQLPSWDII